ncbi:hypothetical protein QBC44DRAFT_120696 [Cladorrhinum sp. PSN332]|nr:hypothetical protein QBC44DRAFT_120696 [Cladorrhinum sp. PSN332]
MTRKSPSPPRNHCQTTNPSPLSIMSSNAHIRRRGVALNRSQQPPSKPGYYPDIQLPGDHSCTPYFPHFPPYPLFSSSSMELFHQYPSPIQQNDWIRRSAEESPSHQTSAAELARLSTRPYSLRVNDQADFASVWESTVIPLLTDLLGRYCESDFAVDVHNFPEMSSEAVPRVIYITLPTSSVDPSFEQLIRTELASAVPPRFNPLYLKFRKGMVQKTNTANTTTTSWWGTSKGERDSVCEPRNITYRPTPVIGISIGPVHVLDAASLGGFIKVGQQVYAMSASHAFEDSIKLGHFRVNHPAEPDLPMITPSDPTAKPVSIGSVTMCAPPGTLRPSLTFRNTNFAPELTKVEMDWCLIGPVTGGKNVVSVPSFKADQRVSVQETTAVEGNSEVYALARTSGYSLGFTSDVPGLQKISRNLRREWTVRQYSPFKHPKDSRANAPWQTLKQWVTSGIGVPGDSGAWLIRRSDNTLLGLIWGRNHDYGDPLTQIRLTYFTPIIDIIDDLRENHATEEDISLPTYTAKDLARVNETPQDPVQSDMSQDPWTVLSSDAIQQRRQAQRTLIDEHFVDYDVPPSGAKVLDSVNPEHLPGEISQESAAPGGPIPAADSLGQLGQIDSSVVAAADYRTTPPRSEGEDGSILTLRSQDQLLLGVGHKDDSLPGLSTSSSVRTSSGSVAEPFEAISLENAVHIVEEQNIDEHMTNVEEPIRTKASFSSRCIALTFSFTKGEVSIAE